MPDRHERRSPSYSASGKRQSDEPSGYERRHSGTDWEQARREAVAQAGGRCQDCGASRPLEVHHETPVHEHSSPEKAHRQDNLVALCSGCHNRRERGAGP